MQETAWGIQLIAPSGLTKYGKEILLNNKIRGQGSKCFANGKFDSFHFGDNQIAQKCFTKNYVLNESLVVQHYYNMLNKIFYS